jgi:hypothetical protein
MESSVLLPAPFSPEQRVDLAGLHLERGSRQRDGGAEALVDAGDPEDRRHSPGGEVLGERRLDERLHFRGRRRWRA